jgi:hypothetical protein
LKKITLSLLAISVAMLMISSVFAARPEIAVVIDEPSCMPCGCGFTPGFWKHALTVYTGGPGNYQSFEGGPLDGEPLTDIMVAGFIADINALLDPDRTAEEFLEFLKQPGWSPNRINTANWFNKVAGYGPF